MRRRALSLMLLSCFVLRLYSPMQAYSGSGKITYTFHGTASGSFQQGSGPAINFVNETFTITAVADPADIVASTPTCKVPSGVCKIVRLPVEYAFISVAGVTTTFITPLAIFDNQTYSSLGLSRAKCADVLDLRSAVFADYDLKSNLAPAELFMKTTQRLGQFNCSKGCVETNFGVLAVESVQNISFTASTSF